MYERGTRAEAVFGIRRTWEICWEKMLGLEMGQCVFLSFMSIGIPGEKGKTNNPNSEILPSVQNSLGEFLFS